MMFSFYVHLVSTFDFAMTVLWLNAYTALNCLRLYVNIFKHEH